MLYGKSSLATALASTTQPLVPSDATKQSVLTPTAVKTSAYTAAVNEFVSVDASTAPIPVTLPATPADKVQVGVKKIDGSTMAPGNAVTVVAPGASVFNKVGGANTLTLSLPNQSILLQYAASLDLWYVITTDVPSSAVASWWASKAQAKPTAPTTGALVGMVSQTPNRNHTQDYNADIISIGRVPDFQSFYFTQSAPFPTAEMSHSAQGQYTMVTWYGWPNTDVIAGTWDAVITARARALRDLNTPIFLRWDIEMNITQYGYGPTTSAGGPNYIAAWQRVYNIFQAQGATNVAFVWCPNANGPNDPNSWRPFYPGDAYVDWVGVDGYNYGLGGITGSTWISIRQVVKAFFDDKAANFGGAGGASKPLMMGETASIENGGSKACWITDAAGVFREQGLKSVKWFNVNSVASGNNYRHDSSDAARQSFREMMQHPYWGGVDPRGQTYAAQVTADAPFGYWKFDELLGPFADSGSGGHAAAAVSPGSVVAVNGGCPAVVGGIGSAVSLCIGGVLDLTTMGTFGSNMGNGFTIETWFKDGSQGLQTSLLGTVNAGTTTALCIYLNTNHSQALAPGLTAFHLRNEAGVDRICTIGANIYDGRYHHLVWVCNPGGVDTIYVDGAAVPQVRSVLPPSGTFADFAYSMYVGARNLRGTRDQVPQQVIVDELAFYQTKLTATRVAAHYAAAETGDKVLPVRGMTRTVLTISTAVTLPGDLGSDYVVKMTAGAAPTLPTAVGNTSRYTLKNADTTAKSIATSSSQTIDGSSTITVLPNNSVEILSDQSNWMVT